MAAFKYFDPYAENRDSPCRPATTATNATNEIKLQETADFVATVAVVAGANRENEKPENVVCFLCGQTVECGTPGTGALAGEDLHMDCYEKDASLEAIEQAAIRTSREL